jgi:hypothetical protein
MACGRRSQTKQDPNYLFEALDESPTQATPTSSTHKSSRSLRETLLGRKKMDNSSNLSSITLTPPRSKIGSREQSPFNAENELELRRNIASAAVTDLETTLDKDVFSIESAETSNEKRKTFSPTLSPSSETVLKKLDKRITYGDEVIDDITSGRCSYLDRAGKLNLNYVVSLIK